MVVCPRCNKTGSCVDCAYTKTKKKLCLNFLPSWLGHCFNTIPLSSTILQPEVVSALSTPLSFSIFLYLPASIHTTAVSAGQSTTNTTSSSPKLLYSTQAADPISSPEHYDFIQAADPIFTWGSQSSDSFIHSLYATYNEVVHWEMK